MQISETRIKLVDNRNDRLKAFCSVTFDNSFVIRDLKIIEGSNGYFVAMPSRKLTTRCHSCGTKNHLKARFCNECGAKLDEKKDMISEQQKAKLHADIAHPVNTETRQYIQSELVNAFQQELEKSKSPDYQPPDLDDFDMDDSGSHVPITGHHSSKQDKNNEDNQGFKEGIL